MSGKLEQICFGLVFYGLENIAGILLCHELPYRHKAIYINHIPCSAVEDIDEVLNPTDVSRREIVLKYTYPATGLARPSRKVCAALGQLNNASNTV